MEKKIPTTLWKTQLLKLVGEAPKATSVECTDLGYQRFPSSSSTSGDDGSDQSIGSGGSIAEFGSGANNQVLLLQTNNNILKNHLHNNRQRQEINEDDEGKMVVETLAALELECINFNLKTFDSTSTSDHSHSPSPQPPKSQFKKPTGMENNLVVMRRNNLLSSSEISGGHRNLSHLNLDLNKTMSSSVQSVQSGVQSTTGTTAAAPWHRPSVYVFNPFGKIFHGYLSHSETHQLLGKDGDFLVRKRGKDRDDDFVLSFRFNGHLKNFIINFDDTSGLIYVGDRDKGYETLQELVQEGLITMYLDHKAGPYIDLMCDLTRSQYNNHHNHRNHSNLQQNLPLIKNGRNNRHSSSGNGSNGHLYTMSGNKWNSSSKQNSPSPSVSSLSRSSMERQGRNPDLKTHAFQVHTFEDLSKCQICQNFLWGLASQGLLCRDCGFTIHEACLERVVTECEPQLSQLSSIFGTDLTVLVKAAGGNKAPFVIEKCISEIEKRGLHIEGIYRVSGSRELTERLKTLLDREREGSDLTKHLDIHSMCGAVKLFLRQLPQPLVTKEVFQRFLNATSNAPPTLEIVRRDLKKLPPANYITLKYVLQHLNRVAQGSDRNKMNPFNLASVFAPTLICPTQLSMETLKTATAVIELMITQVPNLFPKS